MKLIARAGLAIRVGILVATCAPLCAPQASANTLTAAQAAGLSLGTDANYIFIDLGATNLGWNSYQLDGNVLFGQGLTVALSGGNNGGLGAGYTAYDDSTTTVSGSLQNPVTFVNVPTSMTSAALTTADNVSTFADTASNFTAGDVIMTASSITGNPTITGFAGLNIVNIGTNAGNGGTGGSGNCIQNQAITINGPANAFFLFNVNCDIQTNVAMTLKGGVTPSDILWNLTGSGQVLNTSGGNSLDGTFLATDGGQFQFSNLLLDGELINTDGNVQLVSGQETETQGGFTVPTPEPATLSMFGMGLIGLAGFGFWREKRRLD